MIVWAKTERPIKNRPAALRPPCGRLPSQVRWVFVRMARQS